MLDYETLKLIWWLLVGVLLVGCAVGLPSVVPGGAPLSSCVSLVYSRSPGSPRRRRPARPRPGKPAPKKQVAKKPAPKKNMFSAFKEEYDKARHDD